MRRSSAPAAFLALLFAAAVPGLAQALLGTRLTPASALAPAGRFGAAVAIGGDVIAVGAHLSNAGGAQAGAVYLFRRVNGAWTPFAQPILGNAGDQLGFDVSLDRQGRRLLVGAPFARSGGVRCGAVYQSTLDAARGTFTPLAPIELPGACREGAEIGSAVAIEGGVIAFGARGAAARMGRIYASFDGGRFELLAAPGALPGDELGQSLSTDGRTLVAGAPFSDFRGPESGAVYVFRDGARTATRLTPDTLRPEDAFGYSVAVEGGRIAAGAPLSDAGGESSGAVYVREGEGPWMQLAGRAARDQLGVSLALTGEAGFAGARRASGNAGAVFPFAASGLGAAMPSPCPEAGAEFGFAVAARGTLLVVGAFLEDSSGADAGAAYVFEPGTPATLLAPDAVAESARNALVTVNLTRDPACGPLRLTVSTEDAAAGAGRDFTAVRQEVTLSAERPDASVPIPILNDRTCEADESFAVRLTDSSGVELDRRSVTIRDDDVPNIVLTPSPLRLSESGGPAGLAVSLSSPPEAPVIVSLRPDLGTVSPARLRFTPANWNRPQTVLVSEPSLLGDTRCGSNPPFRLTASATFPCGATVSRSVRVARINDDRRCVSGAQSVCVQQDGTILYTTELSNGGDLMQADLPTDEFFLDLPDEVTVVWASANRGLATVDYAGNTVAWNGSIPSGGSGIVKIEILASLASLLSLLETPVTAQGTLIFDREGDGTLDNVMTDDPQLDGPANPTVFDRETTACSVPPP